MTKTTRMQETIHKTIQLAIALVVATGAMASAQEFAANTVPTAASLSLQVNATASAPSNTTPVKDELFAGAEKFAQGASEVTEINLDPSTMGMVSHGGNDATLARKMNFMVIRSYKYEKSGMYSMDDFQAYSKKLTDGTWNCSIHVREKNGSTDICSRTGADHETNEMVILTAEPRELTFIHMSGKMSLNDLNRMGNSPAAIPPLRTH
jgi:Domain of unknown function (DUF4252)